MDLVEQRVVHKTFGEGSVVSCNDAYIKINFAEGTKKFVFPDVFAKYVTLLDQEAAALINKKIQRKEKEKEKIALRRQKEQAFQREQLYLFERSQERARSKNRKIHPEMQSVFWCKSGEEAEIFKDWQVFIGRVKSGKSKGQIRRLVRVSQNSVCLLTKRESGQAEEERVILGAFLAEKGFEGRKCTDGYITAHPQHRLCLTAEEAKKMLFWNYYVNDRFPEIITWNSGRQRYMKNKWMAQILRDIVSLKEQPEEKEQAQRFFAHFCDINCIEETELAPASGALAGAK